jgi:membrane associated rhomboid family serine protease
MNDQPQPRDGAPVEEPARREPVLNLPPVVLLLIGACVAVYVAGEYLLSPRAYMVLLTHAAFSTQAIEVNPAALVTFFTYAFLHGSLAHLVVNMIWLAAFGSPLANRLGPLTFLAFWAFTSALAALPYWVLHMSEPIILVGASGAISGMMGAAARFGFRIDRSHGKAAFSGRPLPILLCLRLRAVVTFLGVWFAINLLTGLVPLTPGVDNQIAWEAHIGGFLAGFFGIGWFDHEPQAPLPPLDPTEEEPSEPERPSGRMA